MLNAYVKEFTLERKIVGILIFFSFKVFFLFWLYRAAESVN